MNNNVETKPKSKVVNWILNILIIVAAFFFLITACVMIEAFADANFAMYSEDSFYYSIQNKNYAEMVGKQYANTMEGHEGNETMQEYYGVAKYYEAASLYKAYSVVGNEEQAAVFAEKMKQAEEEMGGWSIAKDSIHEQLGIE